MSTTARLVIGIGADPGGLKADLERTAAILRQFSRRVATESSRSPIFGKLDTRAVQQADQALRALQQTYATRVTAAKEMILRRVITPAQFQRIGLEAGTNFNQGLLQAMDRLGARGLMNPRVAAGILSQWSTVGAQAAAAFNERLLSIGRDVGQVGRRLTAGLTLPLVAAFALVGRSAGNFQQSMLQVKATTGSTDEVLRILADRARELAGAFTATDIAAGALELARAGLSAKQVYTALPGVIQLAVAAQLDMGQASVLAARGLVQFGLGADQLGHINDVLVTAANRTVTTVSELATAFSFAAGFSHEMGLSLEETTGALALMAQAGIEGTRSGTALVGILNRLANPHAFPAIKQLNLDTRDAAGNLRPLKDIIQQVEQRGITAEKILNAFGQRAGPAMVALVSQGTAAITDLNTALEHSGGTAERFAQTQLDGMNGALRRLKAAAVELGIALGNSGVLEELTRLVRGFADLLKGVSSANATNLKMIATLAAVAVAIGPVLVALGGLIRLLATVRIAMAATAAAAAATGGAIALGGLATLLVPGGILLAGLATLGFLLFQAGKKAIQSAQEVAAFRTSVHALTTDQADQLSTSLQRDLAEAQRVTAEARTAVRRAQQDHGNVTRSGRNFVAEGAQQAVQDAIDTEKRIQAQIDATNDTLRDRAALNRELAAALLKVQTDIEGMDDGVGANLEKWKELKEQVADVSATLAIARARQEDLTQPLAAAQQLYGHITAMIGLWSPAFRRANIEVVQMQETLRVGIQEVLAEIASRPIDALATRLKTLQAQITAQTSGAAAPKGGDLSSSAISVLAIQRDIAAAIQAQGQVTRQNIGVVARYIGLLGTAHNQWVQIGRAIDAALLKQAAATKDVLKDAKDGIATLTDTLLAVGTGLQGVLQGANAFDALGDRAQSAISGVLGLIQAIGQLEKAQKAAADAGKEFSLGSVAGITSLIGIIGAGVGLLGALSGGLFGEASPEELHRSQVLKDNTDAILRLSQSIGDLGLLSDVAGSTIAGVQHAGQAALAGRDLSTIGGTLGSGDLRGELARLGLTMKDLRDVAAGLDISFVGAVPSALELGQLLDAIAQADITRFANTFTGQLEAMQDQLALFDVTDPIQQLEMLRALMARFGDAAISQQLESFNLDSAAGRTGAEALIQSLSAQMQAGTLTPAQLGGLSPDEFRAFLLDFETLIDQANTSLRAFADTLDAQRSRLDLQQALTGQAATPTTAIQHEIELLQQFAPALGAAFQNIDLATAEGKAALRSSLQHLFDLADQGLITQAQLGGLDSVDQVIQIITAMINPLNAMTGAVNDATRSMQNVPEGFKLALRQFQGQESVSPFAPGDKPIPILPPQPPPIEIHDLMPPPLIELNDTLTRILDQFTTLAPITVDDTLSKALLEGTPSFDLLAGALGSIQPSMNRLADAFSLLGDPFGRPIPILPPVAASSAETRPAPGPSRDVPLNFGPISVVVNGAGKDPDQIARETLTELKRQARAALGKSSMWPNL